MQGVPVRLGSWGLAWVRTAGRESAARMRLLGGVALFGGRWAVRAQAGQQVVDRGGGGYGVCAQQRGVVAG